MTMDGVVKPGPVCWSTQAAASLLWSAPMAAALFSGPSHTALFANPRFCQLLERDVPPGCTLFDLLRPQAASRLASLLARVQGEARPLLLAEATLSELWDGPPDRFVRLHLEPLPPSDGSPPAVLLTAAEITLEVRAHRALEQAQRAHECLATELKEARRIHDDFVLSLGHALRASLAPIVSTVESLQLRGEPGPAGEMATVLRHAQQITTLADRMLRATTREAFLVHHVPVARLLHQAAEAVRTLMLERQHRLTVNLAEPHLVFEGDEARLAQALQQLLHNAARFTPPGGSIELSAERRGDELMLRVRDDGIGMAREVLPRVWSPFFQHASPQDGSPAGVGMGLAMVKSTVNLHAGTVAAFSEGPGHGSEFVIRLPLRREAAGEARPLPAPGRPQRVLVVDDHPETASSLAEVLRLLGHEVRAATSAHEALRMIEDFTPQVALLDIAMPETDGRQLLRRLRERPWAQACRFIAVSAYGQDQDRQLSAQAGFEQHLVKPVTAAMLRRLLHEPV